MRRNETAQYIAPLHEDKMSRRLQPQREDGWSRFQTFLFVAGPSTYTTRIRNQACLWRS